MRLIDADLMEYNITHDFDDDGIATPSSDEELTQKCLSINDVVNWLKLASTVDAEPVRHGHWVIEECKNSIDDSVYKRYKCSECNCPTAMFIRSPYCSNCGAKMDGKE